MRGKFAISIFLQQLQTDRCTWDPESCLGIERLNHRFRAPHHRIGPQSPILSTLVNERRRVPAERMIPLSIQLEDRQVISSSNLK